MHPLNKLIKITGLLASIIVLTGCAAGLNEEFSCNEVGGVSGCASMADIRSNMDSYLYHNGKQNITKKNQNKHIAGISPDGFIALPRRSREGHPTRSTDEVAKVTVFPFIDINGHFVDTTDIYLILQDSQWIGRLPRAIKKD